MFTACTNNTTRMLCGLLTVAGCVGAIDPAANDPLDRMGPSRGGPPGMPTNPGLVPPVKAESAGLRPLRRLTAREYDNTVRDLLRLDGYPGITLPSGSDALGESGFMIAFADVTDELARAFQEAAEDLARRALSPMTRLLSCSPAAATDEEPCAARFIREFGKRAFRRPLEPDEVDDLTAFYRQARIDIGYGFEEAIGLLVQRFLQSPSFLYHLERGDRPVREGALVRLGAYEVASRLSYFLWETMPDAALLADADVGRLDTPEGVAGAAARVLGDKRALKTLTAFHRQWLAMGGVGLKDATLYPDFDATIRPSLDAELSAFIDYIFHKDPRLEALLTSSIAFATPASAKLYGLPSSTIGAMKAGTVSQVNLDPRRRAGVLSQLAFLADRASGNSSSPVRRGTTVWRRLLCGSVPAPPKDVPPLPPPVPNVSTRERMARHDESPCASCHKVLDPGGFAFEHFDAIGAYRALDGGKPVDASGSLVLPTTGQVNFNGAVELMQRLAPTEEVRRCAVARWFGYGLGRAPTDVDEGLMEAVYRRATGREAFDLEQLVLGVVQSRTFLLRAPSPGEPL